MSNLKITNVKTILTAPGGIDLAVVKIETNEPWLYGLGCATFTQRIFAVKARSMSTWRLSGWQRSDPY